MAPKDLLNASQAAAHLGVSRVTLYAMVKAEKLAHYRIGTGRGGLRFSPDDLDRVLIDSRVEAKNSPSAPESVVYTPRNLKHVRPKAERAAKARA